MFNFLFTVVGSFIFGYFAAYYAGMDSTAVRNIDISSFISPFLSLSLLFQCFATGLVFGLAVLFADIYFLIKQL